MKAPDSFVELLRRAFDGRYRIRWSDRDQEFHLEHKVATAVIPPVRIESDRDDLIRARDGYDYVMSVRQGDRMPCPECGLTLKVPVRDTWQITCGYCKLKGRTTHVVAGFWPLDDTLIDHLRKIDPYRGAQKELTAVADQRNRLLLQAQENDAMAPGYAAADDLYRRLVGIPLTGYTGKELPGTTFYDK